MSLSQVYRYLWLGPTAGPPQATGLLVASRPSPLRMEVALSNHFA